MYTTPTPSAPVYSAILLDSFDMYRGLNTYAMYIDGVRHSERGQYATRIATSEQAAIDKFAATIEG
jgi:hypothetical protein